MALANAAGAIAMAPPGRAGLLIHPVEVGRLDAEQGQGLVEGRHDERLEMVLLVGGGARQGIGVGTRRHHGALLAEGRLRGTAAQAQERIGNGDGRYAGKIENATAHADLDDEAALRVVEQLEIARREDAAERAQQQMMVMIVEKFEHAA